MKVDHLANPWKVGAAKQVDFPIETVDYYGKRVVLARVPITSRVNAEAVAALVSVAPELLKLVKSAKRFVAVQSVAGDGSAMDWMEAVSVALAKIPGGAQ